jgi:hypothetical protein
MDVADGRGRWANLMRRRWGVARIAGAAALAALLGVGQAAGAPVEGIRAGGRRAPTIALLAPTNCFTSGSGFTLFAFCVSDDGVITSIESPDGVEHINVPPLPEEGYQVCVNNTVVGQQATSGGSGFGPSTIVQPNGTGTFPLRIVRSTTDGALRLAQDFSWSPGTRTITIAETLTNTSGGALQDVRLFRMFLGKIDGDDGDDVFDASIRSVWGRDVDALGLTATTLGRFAVTTFQPFVQINPPPPCSIPQPSGPSNPDTWIGEAAYVFWSLAKGASRTVRFQYRVF